MFKSYYVVWKQDRRGGRIMFYSVFKSYYVVWKRAYDDTWAYYHDSLNRTMQYGNEKMGTNKSRKRRSLNRTMQYGNIYKNKYILGGVAV